MASPKRPGPYDHLMTRPSANPQSTIAPQDMGRPDRTKALGAPIANDGANVERVTETNTLITQAGVTNGVPPILYNGDRNWAKVTMILETAGPVAVSTRANFLPLLSGKGTLLTTDDPFTMTIAKGTRIWYAASSINRVKIIIEPLPWLEQITALLQGK